MHIVQWQLPQSDDLNEQTVDVWFANLNVSTHEITQGWAMLSALEQDRANRQMRDWQRNAYIATRMILRSILARYLQLAPQEIIFEVNQYGKPRVATHQNPEQLSFNLSHSGGYLLCGVAVGREIGVDVEEVRLRSSLPSLVRKVLSHDEQATLNTLPAENQTLAFYQSWTHKEAYVKAVGRGISFGLASVEVAMRSNRAAELLRIAGDQHEAKRWTTRQFTPAPQTVASVVVDGENLTFRYHQYATDSSIIP